MRAAIVAALAVGAMAVPYVKPRQDIDWVTDVEVEYATVIVTVTAGAAPTSSSKKHHYGHKNWHPFSGWSYWTSSSSTAAATTQAPAPSSSTPAPTTSQAPAPTTSQAPAPTSEAPAPTTTSSTSVAAPTTSQQAPSSSAAAPSASYTAPASSGTSYSDTAVWHHNVHRANHSAPDVQWSDALAATAQKIADSCYYAHDTTTDKDTIGGYGQNIAAGVAASEIGVIISDLFYNGEVTWFDGLYGEASPDMSNFEHWGHFSQIVWKDTTHIGCATTDCSSKGGLGNVGSGVTPVFTVCNYQNPGNYAGEYDVNIGAPTNTNTVTGDASM